MKFVRDKAHCKYESYTKEEIDKVSIIANKDLTEVIESSYFVLGEGVTDNHKAEGSMYAPTDKGTILVNKVREITTNENINGETTTIPIYSIEQIIFATNGFTCRSIQIKKEDMSIRMIGAWNTYSLAGMMSIYSNVLPLYLTVGAGDTVVEPYLTDRWSHYSTFLLSKMIVTDDGDSSEEADSIVVKFTEAGISVKNNGSAEYEVKLLILNVN